MTYTRTSSDDGPLTENEIVAAHAIAGVEPKRLDAGHTAFIVPAGAELQIVDVEGTQDAPSRSRGTVKPGTVAALQAYCDEHDDGNTEVWVSTERITAVLNGQSSETVGWGDHRAELDLQHSPEWRHWIGQDGRMLDQATFAEHIEEGLIDIVEPDSAEMLEVAQHFQVTRSAAFRSSQHLGSGRVGFLYDETDEAKAGAGQNFEIPTEFKLGIPVYVGEEAFAIRARFRYRLNNGVLTLGYKIERPDVIKEGAAGQIASRLRGEGEGLASKFAAVYAGEPGSSVSAGLLHGAIIHR
jgi:uncharacterized protein YfdQ (DUF2303 family)